MQIALAVSRRILIVSMMLLPLSRSGHAEDEADQHLAEIDDLVANLDAEEFDIRQDARKKLFEMGEPAREELKRRLPELKKDEKIRKTSAERVQSVEALLTEFDRAEVCEVLLPLSDRFQAALDAGELELKALETTLKSEEVKLSNEETDLESKGSTKGISDADAKTIVDRREAIFTRLRLIREERDEARAKYRKCRSFYASQLAQIKPYLDEPERHLDMLRPMLKTGVWAPSMLPLEARLKGRVTFEFVDTPLEDAVKEISELSGLEITIDSSVTPTPNINLRVTEMGADLALEWVMRLVELEYKVDHELGRVVVRKPEPAPAQVEAKAEENAEDPPAEEAK